MKIAMIIDAWAPIVGGGQVHVHNLCQKLIENHGCEIDLFVRALQGDDGKKHIKDETLFNGKLRVVRCGRPKPFFNFWERIASVFSIFLRVVKENKIQKYDIVHAHSYLGMLSGKFAAGFIKKPIIVTVHGTQILDAGKKNLEYRIQKILLTKIVYDEVITVGRSLYAYKNRNKNIITIGNGINIEEFDAIKEKKSNEYQILFVGRLEWAKGIDVLINAVNILHKNHPGLLSKKHVKFVLVGYGYQESLYKQMVYEYSLSDLIVFAGPRTGTELIKEYKKSSLFILPSISEGFGITILEAMVCNIPVISTKSGGPEDIIQNGKNGFLVEPGDEKSLAKIILKCIEKGVDNHIMQNALLTVQNHFTWDIIVDKIYAQYFNLLQKKGIK